MTKLRKAWLAVAVTAVITTMTGFIPAASAAAPQEGKKISHIGLMVRTCQPFFSAMERNAKQAAAKIGAIANVPKMRRSIWQIRTRRLKPLFSRKWIDHYFRRR